jgi:cob(I)alamin adenosyltransferase
MRVTIGRPLAGLATALALVAVVAGCGGGGRLSKAEYEQRLRQAGDELSTAVQQLAKARTKEQFKDAVAEVQGTLDDAADDLDGNSPPSDVESANERLVHGLRGLSDDFDKVKDAADEGIDAATKKAQEISTAQASREAERAIKEIERRGYDVGKLNA